MTAPSKHSAAAPLLHPLAFHVDGEDVVVGRTDIDSYGVFPPDGAALVRKLLEGARLDEAGQWYQETYGEPVDLDDFLGVLRELDFLAEPSGAPTADGTAPETAPAPVRWRRLGQAVFSRAAMSGYALALVAAAIVMIARPSLAPRPSHLFYTHYVTLIALTVFLGQIPFILIHESFHALAGRRLGIRSTLRIGRRLYFMVFETNLDGLVVVPRRRRYLPLLAGMLADLLVVAVLTLIAASMTRADGSEPPVGGACLALAFATLLRFAWQFYLYARTDLYAVMVNALGCQDLHGAARQILGNRFRRLLRRPVRDESVLHPKDRRAGRWYSWLVLAGYTFSFGMLALIIAPVTWRSTRIAVDRLIDGGATWHGIADSVVFFIVLYGQLAFVAFLAIRARLRRRNVSAPTYLTS